MSPGKSIHRVEWDAVTQTLTGAREGAGMSQSELARKLDRGQPYVWKVENGGRGIDVLEFIDYMQAVNVSPVEAMARIMEGIRVDC